MSIANFNGASKHSMKLMYINQLASEEECRLQHDLKALGASVAKVQQLDEVLERLRKECFDAVLVELDDLEHQGDETFQRLRVEAPHVPVFVVGNEGDFDDDRRAVDAIKAGAHDFIVKSKVNDFDLALRIRAALARQVRDVAALNAKLGAASRIPQPIEMSRSLALPCRVIGMLANGAPDLSQLYSGKTIRFEESRVHVELTGADRVEPPRWVVGVELDNKVQFASVQTTRVEPGDGKCLVELEFVTGERDLLSEETLTPKFDSREGRSVTTPSHQILGKWIAQGVFYTTVVDKELVCPNCHGSATFRYGCRSCGSGRLSRSQMIHHFACAHVDLIESFEKDGQICCPKCRVRNLVVGADFEFLAGPFNCEACCWTDVQAELVGQCLSCRQRFPIQQALEQEHLQFHVDRLDPLAIVAAD